MNSSALIGDDRPQRAVTQEQALNPVILVVDDDFRTRLFIRILLTRATQASVLEAAEPHTALQIGSDCRRLDLLISDIDLRSTMNGVELGDEIAVRRPETKVLLISGGQSPISGLRPEWGFLSKPFSVWTLLRSIGELGCDWADPSSI